MQTWPRVARPPRMMLFSSRMTREPLRAAETAAATPGYAAAYYDHIRFPRNGDGMGLLSDLLWFFH